MSIVRKSSVTIDNLDIPHDSQLPGLKTLLDADKVKDILYHYFKDVIDNNSRCTISYIRYKPATSCLVAYSILYRLNDSDEPSELLFYGKCYTESNYDNAHRKAAVNQWIKTDELQPVVPLPELFSIIYLFPNDCQLDGLQTIYNSRKVRRLLYEYVPDYSKSGLWRISHKRMRTKVVRYKPEKRAVIRINTPVTNRRTDREKQLCLYIRNYCQNNGAIIYNCMKNLYEEFKDKTELVVPQPLVYLSEKQILLVEGLEGDPLLNHLSGPQKTDYIIRTAQALTKLHRFRNSAIPGRVVADLMKDALATALTLNHIIPDKRRYIEEILEGLNDLKPKDEKDNFGFVHGDFYHEQILIQNESEAILDFDRSYTGDAMADVGNFCAHLILLNLQQRITDASTLMDTFLDAYEKAKGEKIDRQKLTFWTVFGLLQLSVSPFRSLEPDWKPKILKIIDECQIIIQ